MAASMRLDAAVAGREHLAPQPLRPGTAECMVGVAKTDITPPAGIHNRCWGAAPSDVATGIHKPLFVSAMAFAPVGDDGAAGAAAAAAAAAGPSAKRQKRDTAATSADTLVLVTVDLGWLMTPATKELQAAVVAAAGVPVDNVLVQLSHTHAGPSLPRAFTDPDCPGGAIALEWWATLLDAAAKTAAEAVAKLEHSFITAAVGKCDLAQKRDLWDKAADGFVCAFNPSTYGEADETVMALRVSPAAGDRVGTTTATVCNYGCHPTSLGHPTSLISPDWPGAARERLEQICGGTSVFVLGACGDTMPVQGHQGDPAVTDRDGSRVGLAAAAAILGMPKPGNQLQYSGPIVSGAVIGAWTPEPLPASVAPRTRVVRNCVLTIKVPVRPIDSAEVAEASLKAARVALAEVEHEDGGPGGEKQKRRALLEQALRHKAKIDDYYASDGENVRCWVWQLGDVFWVATHGEPYSDFQVEIRKQVPAGVRVVVMPMTNGSMTPGYILPYNQPFRGVGCGCYQDTIALMGAGALERLVSVVTAKIVEWCFAEGPGPIMLLK